MSGGTVEDEWRMYEVERKLKRVGREVEGKLKRG